LLRRCVTKNPKERLRDIGEARIVLNAKSEPAEKPTPPSLPRWRRALPWVVAAVLAAALWMPSAAPPPPVPSARFSLSVAPNGFRIGSGGPFAIDLAVSPDGSRIVYVATIDAHRRSGTQLFLRSLSELDAKPLPNTEEARSPFFSADGRFVAFSQDGRVRRVRVEGGPGATIAELSEAIFLGGVWSSAGDIIFAESGVGLKRVKASGGVPELILAVDESAGEVAFVSPDILSGGEYVVFAVAIGSEEPSEIRVLSLEDGSVRTLVNRGAYPRFAAPGHLLFERTELRGSGTVYAVAIDARRAVVTGQPFTVQENVSFSRGGLARFAVSANGVFVYVPNESGSRTVVAVRRDGSAEALVSETGDYRSVNFSPEGRRLVLG
jgi:serine/threonine-protein kinase